MIDFGVRREIKINGVIVLTENRASTILYFYYDKFNNLMLNRLNLKNLKHSPN